MMAIIYNFDGSIKQTILDEYIQQGSTGVNHIFFAIEGRSVESYTPKCIFELANGDQNELTANVENFEIDNTIYEGYKITLTEAQTYYYGCLKMTVEFRDINDNVLFTYLRAFNVNKTDYEPQDTHITIAEYNALISSLNSYQIKYAKGNCRAYYSLSDALEDLPNLANEQICVVKVGEYARIYRKFNGVLQKLSIEGGGAGGAVDSVNGKIGDVVLTADDIFVHNTQSVQANLERIDLEVEGLVDDVADLNEEVSGKLPATKQAIASVGGLVLPTNVSDKEIVGVDSAGNQVRIQVDTGLQIQGGTSPYKLVCTVPTVSAYSGGDAVDVLTEIIIAGHKYKISSGSVATVSWSQILGSDPLSNNALATLLDNYTTQSDIVDALDSVSTEKPLSANQGRVLKGLIDAINIPTKVSDLTNDSGFITSDDLTSYATKTELNAKQNVISDLDDIRAGASLGATALQEVPDTYRTSAAQDVIDSGLQDAINDKQDELIDSGVNQNIKTINGQSILGSGNLVIQGGSDSVLVVENTDAFHYSEPKLAIIKVPPQILGASTTYYVGYITSTMYTENRGFHLRGHFNSTLEREFDLDTWWKIGGTFQSVILDNLTEISTTMRSYETVMTFTDTTEISVEILNTDLYVIDAYYEFYNLYNEHNGKGVVSAKVNGNPAFVTEVAYDSISLLYFENNNLVPTMQYVTKQVSDLSDIYSLTEEL